MVKMSIWYKLGSVKDEVAWKASKAGKAVKDKIEEGFTKTYYKVDHIKENALFEARWKMRDTKDSISDLRHDPSGTISQLKYRLSDTPADKLVGLLFPGSEARLSAQRIKDLDANLTAKVNELNSMLDDKEVLERRVAIEFENGGIVRQNIRNSLAFFASEFEKLHNKPEYKLKSIETKLNVKLAIDHGQGIDFSKLDSALLKIYDNDFNVLSLFKQSPFTSAILKLREKSLTEEVNQCMSEVVSCIHNVQKINHGLTKLYELTHSLNSEIIKTKVLLDSEIEEFMDVMNVYGTDYELYDERADLIIDNVLKMVALAVRLLNTPIYSKEQGNELNTDIAYQVITDLEHNLIESYGAERLNSLQEQYDDYTSLNFEDRALVSVQKMTGGRSVRRAFEDVLVGYPSHFNNGNATSYSLVSERQSYDQDFADYRHSSLITDAYEYFVPFDKDYWKASINQVNSNHDIYTDHSGRYSIVTIGKTFGFDRFVIYDAKNNKSAQFDLNLGEFNYFDPAYQLISAAIHPVGENRVEIILLGCLSGRMQNVYYNRYIYENGRLTEEGGQLWDNTLQVLNALEENQTIVHIEPSDELDGFVYMASERSFIDNTYTNQRKQPIALYRVKNGEAVSIQAPAKVMLDKKNVNEYINNFAFNANNEDSNLIRDNYLYKYLGFGLANKVTIFGKRMFVLDYYSETGEYRLLCDDFRSHKGISCKQRILEFNLDTDEMVAEIEIGIENSNVHEILYHNNRLYAIDLTHGLLVYTV